MRTKLMFFAACGTVPEILFSDTAIPSDWYRQFDLGTEHQWVILLDILTCAKRTSRFPQVPNAQALYAALKSSVVQETAEKNGGRRRARRRALEVLADFHKKFF